MVLDKFWRRRWEVFEGRLRPRLPDALQIRLQGAVCAILSIAQYTLTFNHGQPTEKSFQKDREEGFNWFVPGGDRHTVTPEEVTDAIVSAFQEKSVMDEYLEAMHMNGVDVNKTEVNKSSLNCVYALALNQCLFSSIRSKKSLPPCKSMLPRKSELDDLTWTEEVSKLRAPIDDCAQILTIPKWRLTKEP